MNLATKASRLERTRRHTSIMTFSGTFFLALAALTIPHLYDMGIAVFIVTGDADNVWIEGATVTSVGISLLAAYFWSARSKAKMMHQEILAENQDSKEQAP